MLYQKPVFQLLRIAEFLPNQHTGHRSHSSQPDRKKQETPFRHTKTILHQMYPSRRLAPALSNIVCLFHNCHAALRTFFAIFRLWNRFRQSLAMSRIPGSRINAVLLYPRTFRIGIYISKTGGKELQPGIFAHIYPWKYGNGSAQGKGHQKTNHHQCPEHGKNKLRHPFFQKSSYRQHDADQIASINHH